MIRSQLWIETINSIAAIEKKIIVSWSRNGSGVLLKLALAQDD